MFYVSYITEYPIYEPAEGGYYYAGTVVEECYKFDTWKKANKKYQKMRKAFLEYYGADDEGIREYVCGGVSKYGGSGVYYASKYIGEGARVEITRKEPREKGWEPYC